MKNILIKNWPVLVILGLSILIVWPLFLPGYFSHHDDLQVMRIFEMRKCLLDLQIPCRWVPDMGYGNGYPLFNYYNVFPYYFGAIFSFIFGFIGSAKLLFLIAAILAPVSMYILASELFGVYPGLFSAVLYMFAPYRALDLYVRGALSESFALSIIPLIFYFSLKILKENSRKNILFLSISFAAFLTSHTILAVLFMPLLLFFFLITYWRRRLNLIKSLIFSLALGLGLAAFFVIPAFFEKNLVQIDNLTRLDLDFRAHFATFPQLFLDSSWGYGASFPGAGDTISFQIGWPYWFLAFLSIPAIIFFRKKNKGRVILYLGILSFFIFSIFMTHNKSAFIWENIGILRFTQFPWRFLSVTIFTASLLGGFLIYSLKESWRKITVLFLLAVVVLINWNFFRPKEFYFDLKDSEKLSEILWETQQKASILDYLPVGAVEPREAASNTPIIISGEAKIEYFQNRSNSWELKIDVKSSAQLIFPVFDFPIWRVFEGEKEIKHSKDDLGRITIKLEPGKHLISAKFTDTLTRTISNMISLISICIVLYIIFYGKIRKSFK